VFISECLEWNNGSQLAVQRQRWPTTVANMFTHDGDGSVTPPRTNARTCLWQLSVCSCLWWNTTRYSTPNTTVKIGPRK